MTWITHTPAQDAEGELKKAYERIYTLYPAEYRDEVPAVTKPDGSADSVVSSHSLLPEVMEHIFSAYGRLLDDRLPLSRRQHEMIATLVSSLNRCFY